MIADGLLLKGTPSTKQKVLQNVHRLQQADSDTREENIQGVFCDCRPPKKLKVWKTLVRLIYVDVDRPRYT